MVASLHGNTDYGSTIVIDLLILLQLFQSVFLWSTSPGASGTRLEQSHPSLEEWLEKNGLSKIRDQCQVIYSEKVSSPADPVLSAETSGPDSSKQTIFDITLDCNDYTKSPSEGIQSVPSHEECNEPSLLYDVCTESVELIDTFSGQDVYGIVAVVSLPGAHILWLLMFLKELDPSRILISSVYEEFQSTFNPAFTPHQKQALDQEFYSGLDTEHPTTMSSNKKIVILHSSFPFVDSCPFPDNLRSSQPATIYIRSDPFTLYHFSRVMMESKGFEEYLDEFMKHERFWSQVPKLNVVWQESLEGEVEHQLFSILQTSGIADFLQQQGVVLDTRKVNETLQKISMTQSYCQLNKLNSTQLSERFTLAQLEHAQREHGAALAYFGHYAPEPVPPRRPGGGGDGPCARRAGQRGDGQRGSAEEEQGAGPGEGEVGWGDRRWALGAAARRLVEATPVVRGTGGGGGEGGGEGGDALPGPEELFDRYLLGAARLYNGRAGDAPGAGALARRAFRACPRRPVRPELAYAVPRPALIRHLLEAQEDPYLRLLEDQVFHEAVGSIHYSSTASYTADELPPPRQERTTVTALLLGGCSWPAARHPALLAAAAAARGVPLRIVVADPDKTLGFLCAGDQNVVGGVEQVLELLGPGSVDLLIGRGVMQDGSNPEQQNTIRNEAIFALLKQGATLIFDGDARTTKLFKDFAFKSSSMIDYHFIPMDINGAKHQEEISNSSTNSTTDAPLLNHYIRHGHMSVQILDESSCSSPPKLLVVARLELISMVAAELKKEDCWTVISLSGAGPLAAAAAAEASSPPLPAAAAAAAALLEALGVPRGRAARLEAWGLRRCRRCARPFDAAAAAAAAAGGAAAGEAAAADGLGWVRKRMRAVLASRRWARVATHNRYGEYGDLDAQYTHALVVWAWRSTISSLVEEEKSEQNHKETDHLLLNKVKKEEEKDQLAFFQPIQPPISSFSPSLNQVNIDSKNNNNNHDGKRHISGGAQDFWSLQSSSELERGSLGDILALEKCIVGSIRILTTETENLMKIDLLDSDAAASRRATTDGNSSRTGIAPNICTSCCYFCNGDEMWMQQLISPFPTTSPQNFYELYYSPLPLLSNLAAPISSSTTSLSTTCTRFVVISITDLDKDYHFGEEIIGLAAASS